MGIKRAGETRKAAANNEYDQGVPEGADTNQFAQLLDLSASGKAPTDCVPAQSWRPRERKGRRRKERRK